MNVKTITDVLSKHLTDTDSGFRSRKFVFAAFTSGLIFLGGILAGKWQMFGPHYEAMITGLIGVLTVYLTGNVSSRFVTAKQVTNIATAPSAEKEEK